MTTQTHRTWLLSSRPTGEPTLENFEQVEREVPTPGAHEVLIEGRYYSVDPYMRDRISPEDSYAGSWNPGEPMRGGVVGEIVESNHPEYEVGDIVKGLLEWAEYCLSDGTTLERVDPELAPISTALGVLGPTGRTAYFGLLDVGEPRPGETVLVSGAAGAVGSIVGQIARLNGCRVVGIAGSDEKIAWLTDDLGFDAGINYKTTDDIHAAVGAACPDGVDVYFDNVGGEITDAAFAHLNTGSRVAVCGQIALYNDAEMPDGPRKLWKLLETQSQVRGFLLPEFEGRYDEATERLAEWVDSGAIEYTETVTDGFDNLPTAFAGLFEGTNIGKQLVRVTDAE
ncbi:NADP-dependent oxidoreductase [Halorarius halobius]|uniref:NADP-dependent oxidoreductase n=1 Tax=Halorarius halobius TaxID=2962671 RepID=UPI0020CF6170|nr:NADP-dependent oxidoreductase [Halorarius halobius]